MTIRACTAVCRLGLGLILSWLAAGVSAAPENLVPLQWWKLGLIEGREVRCFDIGETGQWVSCTPPVFMTLPDKAIRILGNERTVAVVYPDHADFYDEKGRLKAGHRLNFAPPVQPEMFITGVSSTESDVVRIDNGHIRVSNAVDPASQRDIAFDCPEIQGRRVYDYEWMGIAAVGEREVLIRRLQGAGDEKSPRLRCVSSDVADFRIPEGAEDIVVFGRRYIGVRQGKVVRFFIHDPASGWVAASTARVKKRMPVQDLQLP